MAFDHAAGACTLLAWYPDWPLFSLIGGAAVGAWPYALASAAVH
jgi:hypothetical protein